MNYYDVLVIGAGFSGLGTALAMAKTHHSVLLLERDLEPGGLLRHVCRGDNRLETLLRLVRDNEKITLQTQAKLQSIGGYHPRFSVHWYYQGFSHYTDIGHIVFALGVDLGFPLELHQSGSGPGINTISDLEQSVCSGNWHAYSGKRMLLVGGFLKPVSPYGIHLMIDRSIALAKVGAQVYFVLPNLVFDEPETTLMYRSARKEGVLFFRTNTPPMINSDGNSHTFELIHGSDANDADPENQALIHGTVDQIVFEPRYIPRTIPHVFWSPHHPSRGIDGFYQPDNPNLAPVKSERKGVFYVGAVTGFKSLNRCREDIAIAAAETLMSHPANPPYAEVDEKKCVACLTCIRLCPHRAIHLDGKAKVAVDACDGCGICAAECPAKAITMVNPGKADIAMEPKPSNDDLPEWLVIYTCNGSSTPTLLSQTSDSIHDSGSRGSRNLKDQLKSRWPLKIVEVPCAGHISVSELLDHIKSGAKAILVAACQPSCCDHIHGNRLAENRVNRVRKMLKSLQLDENRVKIVHAANGMTERLEWEITAFCQQHLDTMTRDDSDSSVASSSDRSMV